MAKDVKVSLNAHADAYGFIYGDAQRGDVMHGINVMPPKKHWQGQMQLEGYEPHGTDWILYIDGEEVARVQDRDVLETEFTRVLLDPVPS